MKRAKARVGIVMGSESDRAVMEEAAKVLADFGVASEIAVRSAHRTPEAAAKWARTARSRGLEVIIAGAGGAAHLAGAMAAHSRLPVLGVPLASVAARRLRRAAGDRADAAGRAGRHARRGRVGRAQRRPPGAAHPRARRRRRWPEGSRSTPRRMAGRGEARLKGRHGDPQDRPARTRRRDARRSRPRRSCAAASSRSRPTRCTASRARCSTPRRSRCSARLKRRDPSYAVISLIPEPDAGVGARATRCRPRRERLIRACWPGPLSIILPASGFVPERVRGAGATVALRCPNDRCRRRCSSASAGRSSRAARTCRASRPPRRWRTSLRYFGNQLDLVLDGGPRRGGLPSTLVDCSGPRPKLLRRGAVDVSALLQDFEDLSSPPRERLTGLKSPAYPRPACPVSRCCACCSSARGTPAEARWPRRPWCDELGPDAARVVVESAGTSAQEGQPASTGTRELMLAQGIDLSVAPRAPRDGAPRAGRGLRVRDGTAPPDGAGSARGPDGEGARCERIARSPASPACRFPILSELRRKPTRSAGAGSAFTSGGWRRR